MQEALKGKKGESTLHWVKFNPNDSREFVVNGEKRVYFYTWEHGVTKFSYYSPVIEGKEYSS